MAKTISLRDANQSFARCIREVEAGAEYIITRNGHPVARLALIGHRRNDTVSVQVPRGPARKLKITKIDVGVK